MKRPHGRSYLLRPGVSAKTSCAACSNKPATKQQPRSGASISSPVATAGPTRQRKPGISLTRCAVFFAGRSMPANVKADPTSGVKNPPRPKTGGFPAWTEDDVERYESRWPIGTKERVWLGVLLYSGLRRGDAVCLGRQHVRDGVATIRTILTTMPDGRVMVGQRRGMVLTKISGDAWVMIPASAAKPSRARQQPIHSRGSDR